MLFGPSKFDGHDKSEEPHEVKDVLFMEDGGSTTNYKVNTNILLSHLLVSISEVSIVSI